MDLLTQEYVLVQAWKKTAQHIRYHNWYSDTLELDRTAVTLPSFLKRLSDEISSGEPWETDPLRMVPAPKSQAWSVHEDGQTWSPVKKKEPRLRPLAHVSLRDQVVATALMLCLADRIESLQGDPTTSPTSLERRRRLLSYGNRLFCDAHPDGLRHRWASSKLYRSYYQDYRSFLQRPELVAQDVRVSKNEQIVVVHSDLRQFYDRVRPTHLHAALGTLAKPEDDKAFFDLAAQVLDWRWSGEDESLVAAYELDSELKGFSQVALPQGLVSAGFFANAFLLDFDRRLAQQFEDEIASGLQLLDGCRYVDDIRLVLVAHKDLSLEAVEQEVLSTLNVLLEVSAPDLEASEKKTRAALLDGDGRLLVRQSSRMKRIQAAVSGGFDALGGAQILESVQGLLRAQERFSEERTAEQGWSLTPVPDVRDATVARFAAGRFRTTYRSLRPLLPMSEAAADVSDRDGQSHYRRLRTQHELDEEARLFAVGLVEHWVNDPSNVRLLRVAFDIWPDKYVLERVLALLRKAVESRRGLDRRFLVASYCLAELFRAGATETGIVAADEVIASGIDLIGYREVLKSEALATLSSRDVPFPWYLRQQALLYLAKVAPGAASESVIASNPSELPYLELLHFLDGKRTPEDHLSAAMIACVTRRSFLDARRASEIAVQLLSVEARYHLSELDIDFGLELAAIDQTAANYLPAPVQQSLPGTRRRRTIGISLQELVLRAGRESPLRDERALLAFACSFLRQLRHRGSAEAVLPSSVLFTRDSLVDGVPDWETLTLKISGDSHKGVPYAFPSWGSTSVAWRLQLGYLLRFILTGRYDFTRQARPSWLSPRGDGYRPTDGHWLARQYGLYNAHDGFGDDWLPISTWMEDALAALLAWPGSLGGRATAWVEHGLDSALNEFHMQHEAVARAAKESGGILLLRLPARIPNQMEEERPLRACVIQTVLPNERDFKEHGIELANQAFRNRHREHVAAALAAVERMLELRETHDSRAGRLDLLILPELSVNRSHIQQHLLPFARTHKTIILAGLTYESLDPSKPFINSALWIVPELTNGHGIQFRVRRQGKKHLAPSEAAFNRKKQIVRGFRPCQWLVDYQWSPNPQDRPLVLSAAVCYDATDLSLAAALRDHSDMLVIPALNRDVNTFDQMALALHYHMYQLVVVANNGSFGGSNAYAPFREAYERQLFHLHGQPQASIAFFEIDSIARFQARRAPSAHVPANRAQQGKSSIRWKFPPAGYLPGES